MTTTDRLFIATEQWSRLMSEKDYVHAAIEYEKVLAAVDVASVDGVVLMTARIHLALTYLFLERWDDAQHQFAGAQVLCRRGETYLVNGWILRLTEQYLDLVSSREAPVKHVRMIRKALGISGGSG